MRKAYFFRTIAEFFIGFGALTLAHVSAANAFPYWNAAEGTIAAGLHLAIAYGLIAALIGLLNGSTQAKWRNFSLLNAMDVLRSAIYAWLIGATFLLALREHLHAPMGMILILVMVHVTLMAGTRVFVRAANEGSLVRLIMPRRLTNRAAPRNALVVAGPVVRVEAYLRSLQRDDLVKNIVGALTVEDGWTGQKLRQTEVYGQISQLRDLLKDPAYPIDGILFVCEPSEVVEADTLAALKSEGITLLRLPRAEDLDVATKGPAKPREIRLDDLLPRPPLKLASAPLETLIRGRRVLVTGAGGSIGSELVRQVAAIGPSHLALVDNCEYNLFTINHELQSTGAASAIAAHYCDVRDRQRLRRVMEEAAPDIVFHAAALKHLPLMQSNPAEAALTNVIGTGNVAHIASELGIGAVVLVSTDKAVRPNSVMGATKRLAESVMHGIGDLPGNKTRSVIVRFGNVLGSSGSVVPLFKEQIKNGGPVLVTDPEVARYFMTIPESVLLILHATALALSKPPSRRNGVYVLEMGEPVKIVDLAKRMIAFYAAEVPGKVEIRFTGLREGEKLGEELIDDNESAYKSPTPGILEVRSEEPPRVIAPEALRALEDFARAQSDDAVRDYLFDAGGVVRDADGLLLKEAVAAPQARADDADARVIQLRDRTRV